MSAEVIAEADRSLKFDDAFKLGFSDASQLTRFLYVDMARLGVEVGKAYVWARSLLHSARAHDVNPLMLYAVVRHESGDFSPRLRAEKAGNYMYPARRDRSGKVVDPGVFGVAQVKYDAHRESVPWAELTLQGITGERADLIDAASNRDNRTVSAISLLIGGKVLKKALKSAPMQIMKRGLRGTSRIVAALQLYNRGTLKRHDRRVRYAVRVLKRWRSIALDAAGFLHAETGAAPLVRLATNEKSKAASGD